MKRNIFVMAFFGVLALVTSYLILRAASSVSVYTLPYVSQTTAFASATATENVLTQTVLFPAAPQVGDAIVCYEGDTSTNNGVAPSDFQQIVTSSTPTSSVSVNVWVHTETATDGNKPLTFSIKSATNWFVGCSDWHGVDPTQPVETAVSSNFVAGDNTMTLSGLTPNEPGTIPVLVGAQSSDTISMTEPSLSNTLWLQQGSGLSAEALDNTTPWYPFTSQWTPTPSFSTIDDSVAVAFFMRPMVGSYALNGQHVAAATPTPSGSSTPAPVNNVPGHIQTWALVGPSTDLNQNNSVTPTQAKNWFTYLEGDYNASNQNPITICAGQCTPVLYYDTQNPEPEISGHTVSYPYREGDSNYNGSTCPEPTSGYLFNTTVPDETWFLHAAGTSAIPADRIGSAGVSSGAITAYRWFANPGSASLRNFIGGVTANCYRSGTGFNYAISQFGALFLDNVLYLPSNNWSNWGAFGYTAQKNVGTETNFLATNAYISGGCPSLYGGSFCTRTTQLSSNQTTALEVPNDSTYKANLIQEFSQIRHNAAEGGGQMPLFINGQENTDLTLLASTPVTGGIVEKFVLNTGQVQNSTTVGMILDVCSTIAAEQPSKKYVIWDTSPGTGTYAEGNANHQLDQRLHFGVEWLCSYPNLVDMSYLASARSTATDVYPFDFVVPEDPIETAGAATFTSNTALGCSENYYTYFGTGTPCTGGGAHDPAICVSGTAPNCVYRREFAHCYMNVNYDNAMGQDLGPCGVLVNMSSSTVNPALSGAGWLKNWSSYTRILLPCVDNGNYFNSGAYATGTTTICNGTTGSDVGNGGQMDISTNRDALTSLPPKDAVFYVANNASGNNGGGTTTQNITPVQSCTGNVSCTFTNTPTNGDLMVAVGFNGIDSFSCNTGWTLIQHVTATLDDGISCYRFASSESTTVTPFSGTAANIESETWEVSNADPNNPIDTYGGGESGATSSETVSITTSVAGDYIVGGGAQNQVATMNTPVGFTNDFASAPCASTGYSCTFDHLQDAASGTVNGVFTSTGGISKALTAMLVAIKPASPGGGSGGTGSTSTPSPTPTPTATPTSTPTPTPAPLTIVQTCQTTSSCTMTTAPVNGNLLIAIGFDGNTAFSCNTGWTSILHTSATYDDGQSCYKVAGASESTTQTPFSGTAADIAGEIWEINGQSASGFIDADAGSESASNDSNSQTISPVASGDLIVGGAGTNSGTTGTTPTSYTNDFSGNPCGTAGLSCLFAHLGSAASGSQSATWTFTGSAHPVTVEMVAVKGGGGGATATPSPTPTPTATPTATPTPGGSGNVAVYDGCTVFKAGDPYNADITNAAVDPYSSSIISALPNDTFDGAGGYEDVNVATNSTPLYTLSPNDGHNPVFNNTNPTYTQIPWVFGSYFVEPGGGDEHAMVLNTSNCLDYEVYKTTPNNTNDTISGYSGRVFDLSVAYVQPPPNTGSSMASGLPLFAGMVKWTGEIGASPPKLNHALNFAFPTGQGVSQYGYVYPAGAWTGLACTGTCTHPLHYGSHLRLHSSFACPSDSEASALCNALKHYGMFYADQGGAELYFADADGAGATNPYNSAIISFLHTVHITDFDVLKEPTLQCAPGHSGCN